MISILISTRNRPEKILDCLNSILENAYKDFEIILVDQSTDDKTQKAVEALSSGKVKYIKMKTKGKSKGLNFGLKISQGEIIAFTDDDCLADKDWLKEIHTSFQENKGIAGLFGRVLAYKPKLHKKEVCPCTFLKDKKKIIDKPCSHWKNIGSGNNMAFKKEIFGKIDGFKEWLGPGSISLAALDAEFALRVLIKGDKLLYNPQIKVYHNRWLTKEEYRKQCLSYSCGMVACYGYFAFKGVKLGKKVVKDNFIDSYNKLKWGIKSLIFFRKKGFRIIINALEEFYFKLRGLVLAFWFAKKDPFSFVPLDKV